ncbi:MAG: hypothetical protein KF754_05915 [Planctomycetes bacterium]|nr:hypothetical protein [Planctomycetota bacterium]
MSAAPYMDPSRLFAIRLPDGFARDERAKSLVFRHPDMDGAVTVSCMRHRLGEAGPDLFESLPGREHMQAVARHKVGDVGVSYGEYEGELQNDAEFWRWWVLQRGPVGIVVSFNGSPEDAETWREEVDALVAGIEIAQRPPLSVEEFTALAARVYADALGKPAPGIIKPLELKTGENSVLRLENAYASYLQAWDRDSQVEAPALLAQWFEQLWGTDSRPLGGFDEVQTLLRPVVKPWGFGRETRIPLLRRTLLEHELELLIAVDTGRTLRFVSAEDLSRWEGVTEEDAFFYARENLLAETGELEVKALAGPDGRPKAVIFELRDSFDAARLTLPNLYERLAPVLGADLLVGVPTRDFMIVLSAEDPMLVSDISAQVKADAANLPYAISGKLFRLTAEGLADYVA